MKLSETARFWVEVATILALGAALWLSHPIATGETNSFGGTTTTIR